MTDKDVGAIGHDENICRICSEPMGNENGHTHDECHEAATEEFEWYP